MKKKEFRYILPSLRDCEFPLIRKTEAMRIACHRQPKCEVQILGNSSGLLYLAKHLAAMALIENHVGMHIHLDADDRLDKGSSLLTICNSDFGFPGLENERKRRMPSGKSRKATKRLRPT